MTFLIKCDGCGKVLDAAADKNNWPGNPFDNISNEKWFSRYDKEKDATKHACSKKCMKDDALVFPL